MRLQHFLTLALVWPILASAALPVGPPQPVTPPAAVVAAGAQQNPVVATSGQETLVGWLDKSVGIDAYVAVLSTDGRVVAGTQRLLADDAVGLRLTWTGRSYLALWTGLGSGGLFAQTLDRDGRPLGQARRILDGSGHASSVAWIGSRGAVAAGRALLLIDDEGNVVTTVADVNRNGGVLRTEVETNGDSFAVFIETTTADDNLAIAARRYTRDGVALESAPVAVAAGPRFTSEWDVAAGGGRYAVVLSDYDTIERFIVHPETLQATRLAPTTTNYTVGTRVEWVGDRFAAVWIEITDFMPPAATRTYRIQTLAFTESGDAEVTSSAPRPGFASDAAVAWNGTRLIVALTRQEESGARQVRAAAIDWRNPDATPEPVAGVRLWQINPAAAMHGRDALLAWIEAVPRRAAARVAVARSTAGVGRTPIYLSEEAFDATPVVISTGSAYLVFWLEAPDYVLVMQRVSLNGTPLDGPLGIGRSSYGFSAAWNGTHVMVAWSGPGGLRAMRIGGDGQPVDTVPIEVARGRSDTLRLATNGTDFLLVWEEGDAQATLALSQPVPLRLRAARISAAGTPDAPFELAPESALERHPSVASDGRDYLVVYVDDVDNQTHVVTKKVLREGTLAGTTADAPGKVVAADYALSTAITASARGYLIAWESSSGATDTFLAGVDRDGETTDPPAVVAWSEFEPMRPAFASGAGRVGLLLYSMLERDPVYGAWMRLFMRSVGDGPSKGRAVRR